MDLTLHSIEGIGEITAGTDLAALLDGLLGPDELRDGDVLVVTSKVISKAEGQVQVGSRDDVLAGETARVVARRGPTTIVENHLGLVMAAAGIDASNTPAGTVVLLPRDPDRSARTLRHALADRRGLNVAVLITDTAGRAWRQGQTDIAIGAAGIEVLESFAGAVDAHGNELAVTEPAVGDEIAGAAELVTGKLGGRPVSIVRGLANRVLPLDQDGAGARVVVRPREQDLFALGAREAVIAAVAGEQGDAFGAPADAPTLLAALSRVGIEAVIDADALSIPSGDVERARVLAFAHGWTPDPVRATHLVPTP